MKNLESYFRPNNIREAYTLLNNNPGSKILGGGTTIVKMRDPKVRVLIDIKQSKIDYIKKDSNIIHIGAATRIEDILKSPVLKATAYGIFPEIAGAVGSTLTRNLITLGGNIVQLFYWSDMPIALLLTDSNINIFGKTEQSICALHFFEKNPKLFLSKTDIVTEINYKIPPAYRTFAFTKFAKTKFDYSIINVGVSFTLLDNKVSDSRIAVSALTRLPQRVEIAEDLINGKPATDETFEKAGTSVSSSIEIRNDSRASKEYRKEILPVLVKRTFQSALRKIGGTN